MRDCGVTVFRVGSGPLSQVLERPVAKRILRLDLIKDGQIVRNLPVPLTEQP